MSATMMLNYIAENRGDDGCKSAAERIKSAYSRALEDGQTTGDLGGKLNTMQFSDAVIERL